MMFSSNKTIITIGACCGTGKELTAKGIEVFTPLLVLRRCWCFHHSRQLKQNRFQIAATYLNFSLLIDCLIAVPTRSG